MEFNAVQLIRTVRDHPELYDATRPEFKLPAQKDILWRKIAMKIKVNGMYNKIIVDNFISCLIVSVFIFL